MNLVDKVTKDAERAVQRSYLWSGNASKAAVWDLRREGRLAPELLVEKWTPDFSARIACKARGILRRA